MQRKSKNLIDARRSFLDIPYEEYTVPFPNTAALIQQQAREFPDRIAFRFEKCSHTFSDILQFCLRFRNRESETALLCFRRPQEDLLPMLALLYHGIPFDLNFSAEQSRLDYELISEEISGTMDLPFIGPENDAFILNDTYLFSQYNILVAAQNLGRVFHLFRPGDACSYPEITTMSDLLFGILAPFYFAKSIDFNAENPAEEVLKGKAQYAWSKGVLPRSLPKERKILRDAALVFWTDKTSEDIPNAYYIYKVDNSTAGLALMRDSKGNTIAIPGCDFHEHADGSLQIHSHAVGFIPKKT